VTRPPARCLPSVTLPVLRIRNRDARWLWLSSQGLTEAPTGNRETMDIIRRLGFVQLDTIRVVSRAHHHILWSRNQAYREPMMNRLLANDRHLFEHFTHDASVLPMEIYPVWRRQFRRLAAKREKSGYYKNLPAPAVRDRTRLERLFGFDYRIEIFVPAAKRRWGYYVYPLLEGDRFVGRIEVKADRKASELAVLRFWQEPGVPWTAARRRKLDAELTRLARFVGVKTLTWDADFST